MPNCVICINNFTVHRQLQQSFILAPTLISLFIFIYYVPCEIKERFIFLLNGNVIADGW